MIGATPVVSHPFSDACRFLEYVESGGGVQTKGGPHAAAGGAASAARTPIWPLRGQSMLRGDNSWRSSARHSG